MRISNVNCVKASASPSRPRAPLVMDGFIISRLVNYNLGSDGHGDAFLFPPETVPLPPRSMCSPQVCARGVVPQI